MFDIKEYGALLAGIAAFFTSLLGWIKWGTDKSKTPVSIAVKGNSEIQDIIDQIVRNNKHINIVTVTEITNGGGIPEVGKPLYMKSLLSTDAETLLMYSDKYLLEGSLTTATSKVILNGDTVFMPDDLSDHGLRAWFASKKIVKTVYFLIGIDAGTRVVLLAVNYNTLHQSNDAEYFSLLTSAKKIKKIIERSKGIKKLLS
jgi:hypothetical protein